MADTFEKWVQSRLVVHGFSVVVDGLLGPRTRKALLDFQRHRGLGQTGTTTPATVEALRANRFADDSGPASVVVRPPWLAELERRKGLHEVRDETALSKWLRSDGWFLGNPRVLPWCGDAIQTALALTLPNEPLPSHPGLARNWLLFGKATAPRVGAIAVFWRGSRTGTSGHVAIVTGEDRDAYHVLGGNQSNAITETRMAKDRLLGTRWPVSFDLDTTLISKAANGRLSTNEA